MRRYDDPVDVRRQGEAPEQFLWHGRLWKVRDVLAHWVETGAWWQSHGARAVIGSDDPADRSADARHHADLPHTDLRGADLLGERELWRVEAGHPGPGEEPTRGVFDLSFDWSDGQWQLVGCLD